MGKSSLVEEQQKTLQKEGLTVLNIYSFLLGPMMATKQIAKIKTQNNARRTYPTVTIATSGTRDKITSVAMATSTNISVSSAILGFPPLIPCFALLFFSASKAANPKDY